VQDETALTTWIRRHLCFMATLPFAADTVFAAEQRLLELADPRLNLRDVERTPLRLRLTRLRSGLSAR